MTTAPAAVETSVTNQPPPLRVALLLTGLSGGGAQRRTLTLAAEFLRRGHRVDVVVPSGAGAFRDQVPATARLFALDPAAARLPGVARRKSLTMLASVASLARYLRREKPDVMLSSSTPANLAALAARDLARGAIPVVACVNVPVSRATAARGRPLLGLLIRHYYPRADAIITIAAALADDTAAFTGVARERIVTVPFPIAADEIRELARETADHPWFAAGQPPVVLAVGKLKPQKDFATLVRAFAEVRRLRPARLLILGEGEQRSTLLALARELGVADDVSLPGFARNPFPAMARAAVLALPSRWEGFSNAASEALACGCPVVATRCPGGVAELLADGRYGALVEVGNAAALAGAIVDTLDRPPPKEMLRARADEFSVARAAERYLQVLRDCTCGRSSSAARPDPRSKSR
ncbi:MAG: glycosyltransferase [Deltaproteobacteria bacterium]|nr:glycosyltransferase [Deltaproteobacteria bacterium]